MCRAEGLPNPHHVLADFRSKSLANDYRYADWDAAFRNWMRSPITRRDYPVWEPEEAAPPAPDYGPPSPPTAEQLAILERVMAPGPRSALLAEAQAADLGAAIFWTPKARAEGGP
jgi:hypothetical protein